MIPARLENPVTIQECCKQGGLYFSSTWLANLILVVQNIYRTSIDAFPKSRSLSCAIRYARQYLPALVRKYSNLSQLYIVIPCLIILRTGTGPITAFDAINLCIELFFSPLFVLDCVVTGCRHDGAYS